MQAVETLTYDEHSRTFQHFDMVGDHWGVEYKYNNRGYLDEVRESRFLNANDPRVVYVKTQEMDARGNVTKELLGNGVTTTRMYDANTGRLTHLGGSKGAIFNRQDLTMTYDVLGNLRSKWDKRENLSLRESYCYDSLNRLVKVHANTTTGSCGGYNQSNGDFRYDVLGNITYKAGVGSYTYHSVKKHAVVQAGSNSYSYDNNGNMIVGSGKSFTYAAFDKPTRISRNNNNTYSEFDYGADRDRFKRVDRIGNQIRRTWYVGNSERIQLPNGTRQIKRRVAGRVVLTHTLDAQNKVTATSTNYLLKDHLGSVVAVLDTNGNNIQAMSYDVWGRRASPTNWQQALPLLQNNWTLTQLATRSYTGHEPIDSMGLIHMNGRVYDPQLGRFTQADPFIQFPDNSQSYNRYSYVLNNPLIYTDPSGHFLATIAGIVAWAAGATAAEAAVVVAMAAFAEGIYSGAGLGDALIAGVSAAALTYVGGQQFGNGLDIGFNAPTFAAVAKVGTVGGAASMLQGGKFGHGFVSAGLGPVGGKAVGGALGGIIGNESVRRVVSSSIVGGTLSSMTGGKFANGARYAAFASIVSEGADAYANRGRGTPDNIDESGPVGTVQNVSTREYINEDGVTVRAISIEGTVSDELGIKAPFIKAVEVKWSGSWNDSKTGVQYQLSVDLEPVLMRGDVRLVAGTCNKGYACAVLGGRTITVQQATRFSGDPTAMAHEYGHLIGFRHAANGSGNVMSYDMSGRSNLSHARQLWSAHHGN